MYVEKFGGQREDNGRTTSSKPTRSQYRTKAHNNNIAMCAILVAFPQNKHLQGLCNTTRLFCHYGRRRGHCKARAGTFQYNPRQCMQQSGLLRRAGVGGRTTRSATFHIVGLTPHKATARATIGHAPCFRKRRRQQHYLRTKRTAS